ncbi:MAG: 4Fe-4S double cluster binding domain-containing protein [Bacillota bacterium]
MDSESIKKRIKELGANEVGIGDVSVGIAPEFSHMPRAIALAIKHPHLPEQENPTYPYIHFSLTIDRRLLEIQRVITGVIRRQGWRALPIPPDSCRHDSTFIARLFKLFPHKTAATCAGLGWVGKSGLLISKRFGPLLSWATILTNAPLQVEAKPVRQSFCGCCRRCVEACPAGAIEDKNWRYVSSYRTIINVERCVGELQKNKERYGVYACGICMLVCPQGRNWKMHGSTDYV